MKTSLFRSLLFFILITWASIATAQNVYLVGNAHQIPDPEAYFSGLSDQLDENQQNFLVVNGDIWDGKVDKTQLTTLLDALDQTIFTRIFFNFGDGDWRYSKKDGWKMALELDEMISDYESEKFEFPIDDACPGPEEIELSEHTTLIIINTQWWNHPYRKPTLEDADCTIATAHDFTEELDDIINENEKKNIIIAGHYPIRSYGKYGGYFPIAAHFNPLPVLGSFKVAFHQNEGSAKDIHNHRFAELTKELQRVLYENSGVFYLSSHEKNQQIINHYDDILINSGAPFSKGFAPNKDEPVLLSGQPGVISLSFETTGAVTGSFLKYDKNTFQKGNSIVLQQSPCVDNPVESIPVGRSGPCMSQESLIAQVNVDPPEAKYITKAPGKEYKSGWLKELIFGKHYRDTWSEPVKAPYLDLDTTFSGLTPYELGGGRQTQSLKLDGGNGMKYTFRSVDKEPKKAVDYQLRQSVVANVAKDQTSTQHPYGSVVTDVLLNELGIIHPHPKLYAMPSNKKLGPFHDQFVDMYGLLEEKPFGPDDDEFHYAGADDILKSHKLFRELYEDKDNRVDQEEFILARMFDIWVGDWSKHEENWKWAEFKTEDGAVYRPIPRDRDHVFSQWDGLLPYIFDREWALPNGEHFDEEINDIRSLTWQARHMDRLIANKMTREDWKAAARKITETFTPEMIGYAVRQIPEEVYPLSGPTLERRLIARLDDLEDYAEQQYELLARYVDIVGSEGEEHFEAVRNQDGTVTVTMMDKDDNIDEQASQEVFYKRTFHPDETHEIRLYGLDDDDRFVISGDAKNSIRIRVIGGPDTDEYIDNSTVGGLRKKTLIYDKGDDSMYQLGKESKQVNIPYLPAYNYERTHFAYNRYLPIPYLGFNNNDGFFFSPGVRFTNHRYGKPDFSSKHTIRGFLSTEGVRLLKYDVVQRHVIGKTDLTYGAKYADADRFAAFYGLGNETPYSQDLFDANYYNTTRALWNVYLGIQKNLWSKSLFSARVRYESNEPEVNDETILSQLPALYGLERLDMVEFLFSLDLDFRDNGGLPYQGTRLVLDHNHGQVFNDGLYGVYFGALEYYETIGKGNPLTVGLRGGGSGSYGEIPFYKLTGMGQNQFLRGYQANRFVGNSMWFFNSELRYTFINSAASFLPFKFGLKAFYDVGQVFAENTETETLHRGYGGGIYFVPFKEQFTISLTAGWSEENSGLLQIAIGTPLQ